jgi:hypothetical protein
MSNPPEANCEIVIATTISDASSEWFDGFEVTAEGTISRLTGTVVDQAALHGVLGRLRDLGIPILDVHLTPVPAVADER